MKLPKAPKIRDCMETSFDTLAPSMPIMEAITALVERRVTGAPVVDDDGHLVGILTEKDCLALVTLGDAEADRPHGVVSDYMTTNPQSLSPDMDIYYAAGRFLGVEFRRFTVVDEEARLVGVLTRLDLLRSLKRLMAAIPLDEVPVE